MSTDRKHVYKAIDGERDYQDAKLAKLGIGALDRTIDEFALYIVEYAAQLRQVASTSTDPDLKLDAVRKVAALGVACMEAHGVTFR